MRKTLLWMQVILMIALAKTRLNAAPRKEEHGANWLGDETEQLPEDLSLEDLAPIPGIDPQFSGKLKSRGELQPTEGAQPEEDYMYERFGPFPPPVQSPGLSSLAKLTELSGGQFFPAPSDSVPDLVSRLVTEKGQPGHDLVFLVDQTGSMDNDVSRVRHEVQDALKSAAETGSFRVGVATYSGVSNDGEEGFSLHDLEPDPSFVKGFLKNIDFKGGTEDLYGGAIRTAQEINWAPGSKRTLIVLTDEPAETKPEFTDYSEDEMLAVLRRKQVELVIVFIQ